MRARFRIEYHQLTYYERQLLDTAFKSRSNFVRNHTRQLLASLIRNALARQNPTFKHALLWCFRDHIQVYLPTEPLRFIKLKELEICRSDKN